MTSLRVLVVGAGVAGLAVASALARRGLAAEVVERAAEWQPTGAGLYLPGNAVRALDELGLGAAVAERAQPIGRQRFLDHRGRLLAAVDVVSAWDGVGPCVAMHRAALHEVLRAAAEVPVRLGTAVTGVQDGAVPAVTFSDGSTEAYDLVVGADGVHSTIRRSVFGGPPAGRVGQVSWRFVADGFPDVDDWTVRLGRGRAFLTVALGGGRTYCYADLDASDPAGAPDEDWRAAFADFAEPVPQLLEQATEAYVAPIEEVVPPAWSTGRVVLVGDAAHASSPNMAQGAAMAVEDALVLAELLSAEATVEQALSTYERRRAPRVDWVQAQTHRRDRTRSLPVPLRNLVLRTAGERIYRSNYRPLRDPF
ncbi:MAG TPA: FAD-dependent monooxygenase [Gaiellaceae bacterium]|nr:FAD-dependent monooxygenase [Gaiellaceae bacterium]